MRISWNFFALVCVAASLGCNHETSGNVDRRERDRENERTQVISDEYQKAAGLYGSHISSGEVRLTVKTAWSQDPSASGSSATAPQPVLVGVLSVYPDLEIAGTEPLQFGLPIDSGTYSDQNKNMALSFKSHDSTSRLVCDMTDGSNPRCQWFTNHGVSSLNFKKLEDSSTEAAVNRQPPGAYHGQSTDFDITASFQTIFSSPGSGQGVRPMIAAHFSFADRNSKNPKSSRPVEFSSLDGAYDPQTDTLSFTIDGATPISVNCQRQSRKNLKCQWSSIHYIEFSLTADD